MNIDGDWMSTFKVDVIIVVVNLFIYFHIPLMCCSFKKQFLKSGPFLKARMKLRRHPGFGGNVQDPVGHEDSSAA
jgi:hypothetical protein